MVIEFSTASVPEARIRTLPAHLGSDELTMNYQKELEANGLLTVGIRPPTVPEGQSRLRVVIRRNTPEYSFEKLIKVLKKK